jgi:mono/diheme cytochrome c family protein
MKIRLMFLLVVSFLLSATPVLAADGAALYKDNCAKCHGTKGGADNFRGYLYFARNFSKPGWQAARTDDEIMEAINRGPRIMPSFRESLSEDERTALVKMVRSLGR